jgi:Bax protein
MRNAVRKALIALPLCSLLLGVAGRLGVGAALGDSGQEVFLSPPSQQVRDARAAVPTPRQPVFARPPTTVWLRGTMGRTERPVRAGSTLPEFAHIHDIQLKKERFFSYLLPLVREENDRLAELRRRLGFIQDLMRWGRELDEDDRAWLSVVATEFRVNELAWDSDRFWLTLLQRVDALPEELVLVQAANESAWGTSRFAREGNNLFGQWCFARGCGIVPAARPEGATYEVARFASVRESVGSYMRNLNTGRSYRNLREIRARLRAEGRDPLADDLAAGLLHYSERGQEYVDEIRAMLRYNATVIAEVRGRVETTSS